MARLIESIIGHQGPWQNLMRQMENGHLAHAMTFAGPSGIGKKRVGWALAQALVCDQLERPCGECAVCRRVENQQCESVLFVEPEKGTIKLEATHQILEFLNLRRIGRARVILIDGAQSMNPRATNALLKVIEEPPPETYFILLVNELSQLLPTLRSRVQVVRFSPLSEKDMRGLEPAADWMLRSARGSFEQLSALRDESFEDLRRLTIEFLSQALQGRREGLDALMDRTKEREATLTALHFLQQMLRDWSLGESAEPIHSDLSAQFKTLRPVRSDSRIELWQRSFQVEQDFKAHVDRALLFENLFNRIKHAP